MILGDFAGVTEQQFQTWETDPVRRGVWITSKDLPVQTGSLPLTPGVILHIERNYSDGDFATQPWLAWHLLNSPGCPKVEGNPFHLSLQDAGIKANPMKAKS